MKLKTIHVYKDIIHVHTYMHKYRHNAAYKSVLSYWVQILYKETYSHTLMFALTRTHRFSNL